jgi:hypothetical protein
VNASRRSRNLLERAAAVSSSLCSRNIFSRCLRPGVGVVTPCTVAQSKRFVTGDCGQRTSLDDLSGKGRAAVWVERRGWPRQPRTAATQKDERPGDRGGRTEAGAEDRRPGRKTGGRVGRPEAGAEDRRPGGGGGRPEAGAEDRRPGGRPRKTASGRRPPDPYVAAH